MERPLRHVGLHQVGDTELRVVSDVDEGVVCIVQAEEDVIRRYAAAKLAPPRCVSLFVLRDLQPLMRSVPAGARSLSGDPAALADRPVINIYDPTDLATCHVFVNRQALEQAGYWDDPLAVHGLLAHEHAHPLAENAAVRASRGLAVELKWEMRPELAPSDRPWRERVDRLLAQLVDKLCVLAPREVFANELAIRAGFDAALLHLNERNAANAARGVERRPVWLARVQRAERTGELPRSRADVLVLLGDLSGHLDMALEVAAFLRAGKDAAAGEIEERLLASVFPALEPEALTAYTALRDRYVALSPEASRDELVEWTTGLVGIVAAALRRTGLELSCRVRSAP